MSGFRGQEFGVYVFRMLGLRVLGLRLQGRRGLELLLGFRVLVELLLGFRVLGLFRTCWILGSIDFHVPI